THGIPEDLGAAADLYRTLLDGRKMLVVLDNAGSVEQIRPLLPGSVSCQVVVTSRDRLAGLVAREGATRIELDALSQDESIALVASILGSDRLSAQHDAIADLVRLCGRLPLALRITAAVLADHPSRLIDEHVEALAGPDRLSQLEIADDPDSQ